MLLQSIFKLKIMNIGTVLKFLAIAFIATSLSSCAAMFGGKVSDCQRTKPAAGQPARRIKTAPFILDLIFFPIIGTIVDFATGVIYEPCETPKK